MAVCSGLIYLSKPIESLRSHRLKVTRSNDTQTVPVVSLNCLVSGSQAVCSSNSRSTQLKCAASSGRNYQQLRVEGDRRPEPFWLTLAKESMWGLRSLAVFLVEQPGQLRFIEWPSFQNTLKTATLTLVLVAVLIVALASIDSALSYLLALLLRKPA